MKLGTALVVAAALLVLPIPSALAQMGMPDARQMSGMPLPVGDMPVGTITIRVVRGNVANTIPDQLVELTVDGVKKDVKTDPTGHATFDGLKPGATVKARTTVGKEVIESEEFSVPPSGGIRMMLVAAGEGGAAAAGSPAGAAASGPAQPGDVSLGLQSRIVIEPGEDAADVFYLLDIRNSTNMPVNPKTPFTISLPKGAQGATIMEGSSPQATAAGTIVSVAGPFAPGATMVQVAYRLPYEGGAFELNQAFPASFSAPNLAVRRLGGVTFQSPQFPQTREVTNEGQTYLVASGAPVAAGTPIVVTLDGVPHHPAWPRYTALALAVIILAAGAWGASSERRHTPERETARKQLQARREKLLNELSQLEQRYRAGAIPEERYTRRRSTIVEALEDVLSELDEVAAA